MRRGTQGHVAEPRGPAQRLRGAYYILYSYITYSIMGIQPPVYREGIRPLRSSGVINPTILFFYFCVGLIHTAVKMQVTWSLEVRWIGRSAESLAPIKWTWTTDRSITHVSFKWSYNGQIFCDVPASHASITWCVDHRS